MTGNLQKETRAYISSAERLVILGIGNPDKGDDAAGPLCADLIKACLDKDLPPHVRVINAGVMPENYTGDIRKFQASHVLIIDAVIGGKKPGTIFKVDPKGIINEDVSTHRMSLSMLTLFINDNIGANVFIIGIEPKVIYFDTPISKIVYKSIKTLVQNIALSIRSI